MRKDIRPGNINPSVEAIDPTRKDWGKSAKGRKGDSSMPVGVYALILFLFAAIGVASFFSIMVHHGVPPHQYAIMTGIDGKHTIREGREWFFRGIHEIGYYSRGYGFNIPVTAYTNEGATPQIMISARFYAPTKAEDRVSLHREFRSAQDIANHLEFQIIYAVKTATANRSQAQVLVRSDPDFLDEIFASVQEHIDARMTVVQMSISEVTPDRKTGT